MTPSVRRFTLAQTRGFSSSLLWKFLSALSFVLALYALMISLSVKAEAQGRSEYRGFWVDTFNTPINNHDDVVNIVSRVKAANANAIFAQVRRRGDSWYLNSLEPLPDFTPIAEGFDPLQDLITEAHAEGIEVHAFVIIGAIWNKNPNFPPSQTLGPPTNPNHVFNRHGGYDPETQMIKPGPDNWLTRTLLPDGTGGISFQGHRFGNDFWIDLGHPDAAQDTFDVLMHLVKNYDIDGLHLDRIRYPELGVPGQTPSTGANIGYNETSVARFQKHYGIEKGSEPPEPNDPRWVQWRRDQVTNFVRRIYLNAVSIKPQLKVTAALIVFGGGPTTEAGWNSAEAYWRVYQDWRAWSEEGILDIAIPMNYKAEHTSAGPTQYDTWNEWLKNHQYNRAGMVGLGVYLNSIEGTLRQARRALAPSAAGYSGLGAVFYSFAVTNTAVNANPFSIPPGQNTPARPFAEFASGLTTGKSIDGTTLYEPEGEPPVFSEPASIPVLHWKASPTVGHVMGYARCADGSPLDTAIVTIENLETGATRTTQTDGNGFYGGVDLAPGRYRAIAELGDVRLYTCAFQITPGVVTAADFNSDTSAPAFSISANPSIIWPPDGRNVEVTISGEATDDLSGLASVSYTVVDEYGTELSIPTRELHGNAASWTDTLTVKARRKRRDRDGRRYLITATITDRAGNSRSATAEIVVPHRRKWDAQSPN